MTTESPSRLCSWRDPGTLVGLLRHRARREPRRWAYSFVKNAEDETVEVSYGELERRARRWAERFRQIAGAGDRVLLLLPPGIELIAAFFGAMYGGLIAVPAPPPSGNRQLPRLRAISQDAAPAIVVAERGALSNVDLFLSDLKNAPATLTPDSVDTAAGRPDDFEALPWTPASFDPESVAMIQYTSGTTRTPRGVKLTHRNLLHNSAQIAQRFGHSCESLGVIWLPPYHDMGLIGGVIQPLFVGFPVVLMSPLHVIQQPVRWLRAISRWRATTSGGPNFAYDMCVAKIGTAERARLDLRSWKVAFTGAEPVRPQTLEKFQTVFATCGFSSAAWHPCYGLAEATLMVTGGVTAQTPRIVSIADESLKMNRVQFIDSGRKIVGCGRAWDDQRLVIVDPETRRRCAPDRIGEIWVSGPSVAAGYWNSPLDGVDVFEARLEGEDERLFLRTGDLGFIWEGDLYLTGRLKDILIVAGRNYYLQDIERTIESAHSAVQPAGCAAFSVERGGNEQLVAAVEIKRAFRARVAAGDHRQSVVRAIHRAVAEEYDLRITDIVLVQPSTLSKTASGKLRRSACRDEYVAGTLSVI